MGGGVKRDSDSLKGDAWNFQYLEYKAHLALPQLLGTLELMKSLS